MGSVCMYELCNENSVKSAQNPHPQGGNLRNTNAYDGVYGLV